MLNTVVDDRSAVTFTDLDIVSLAPRMGAECVLFCIRGAGFDVVNLTFVYFHRAETIRD